MKRILAFLICLAMMIAAAGCGRAAQESSAPEETSAAASSADPGGTGEAGTSSEVTEDSGEPGEGSVEESAEESSEAEEEKAFRFNPKVASVYLYEIFGEEMVQTWFNIVDAALAGEESFEGPDTYTRDWVIGQFPDRCFPVMTELIESSYNNVVDGVGTIRFKTSREEFIEKETEFEALVEDILNTALKPEYSDVEKALALYVYFCGHYTYDYDTYNRMFHEPLNDFICSYRLLTGGTGICAEISAAYSYLLMQVGVDATIMMGGDHQWSYVRINGKNYHIDPTFALGDDLDLQYFMMNDEKRSECYTPDQYVIASNYSQDHPHPDYKADDDYFAPLWEGVNFVYLDHEANDIHCTVYNRLVYQDLPWVFSYDTFEQ